MKRCSQKSQFLTCLAHGLDFFGGPPMRADDLLRAAQWGHFFNSRSMKSKLVSAQSCAGPGLLCRAADKSK